MAPVSDQGGRGPVQQPTPIVETHGSWLLKGLLAACLRGGLPPGERFWELAAMAANLHTFTQPELESLCVAAGFRQVRLETSGFAETLIMTASYAVSRSCPGLASRIPWRGLTQWGVVSTECGTASCRLAGATLLTGRLARGGTGRPVGRGVRAFAGPVRREARKPETDLCAAVLDDRPGVGVAAHRLHSTRARPVPGRIRASGSSPP
jgi:hypothetical protein